MTGAPPPPMVPSGPTSPNSSSQNTTMDKLQLNLSNENLFRPPGPNPPKPGWRPGQAPPAQEEAIPSDSLYNGGSNPNSGTASWREKQFGSRPSLNGMAHWSSHGYLAKANENAGPNGRPNGGPPVTPEGYVVLKRQGDQMITSQQASLQAQQQPQSLPVNPDRKYFSVKNYGDFRSKHNGPTNGPDTAMDPKYYSLKNLPPDIRAKLRENLASNPYQAPPLGQFQRFAPTAGAGAPVPPPPVPARPLAQTKTQNETSSKSSGNSVSWHEWTQQLQAYIAWVNSQLRKRPELRPVQDLRTDLQSGEVLAQLIEIISSEKIAGIQYRPESLQGMRENIERILQFMASKRIKMHQITSKEILEGNLKAVMRLILALAAHYKPQSVRHHDNFEAQEAQAGPEKPANITVEDSTLNQTTENILETSTNNVKRSPSLNEGHYSKKSNGVMDHSNTSSGQIYENFSSSRQIPGSQKSPNITKAIMEPKMPMDQQPILETSSKMTNPGSMTREGSFVRTGSGRKLPKIPGNSLQSPSKNETSEVLNTSLPCSKISEEHHDDPLMDHQEDGRKSSKPKALEFWESLETVERSDFRYNTIHRMSVGRRMLPKAPESNNPTAQQRSQSLDRNNGSLNSSFEKCRLDSESSVPSSPPPKGVLKPNNPDALSLRSSSSAQPSQPSPPSSDSRGEVEGSSDNNSPPTSVIQGKSNNPNQDHYLRNNPAYDWLKTGFLNKNGSINPGSIQANIRLGDGHSGSDSKHSDTMSDQGGNIPYDILLQDLTQAKRQLLELHNLVSDPFLKIHNFNPTNNAILLENRTT